MVIAFGAGLAPVAAAAVDAPSVVWQKCLGGSSLDVTGAIHQTADGGYVVAGVTNSTGGGIPERHSEYDVWVMRLDATGGPVWQRCLGGSQDDVPTAVQQTTDGGYVVAGQTRSNDGDVSGNHGSEDAWVVKLDATGDLLWQRCLGGSYYDVALAVQQTVDGGYVVAGGTCSNDGDVTGNHGSEDAWVVKLDATGAVVWQRCLGGTVGDWARAVRQTSDGGYIVAGCTYSTDGDLAGLTGYPGLCDFWVVKLDATGELLWQRTPGASYGADAYAVQQTPDGEYIVAGWTVSTDGNVTGHHGSEDYWVVKLNATGELLWQTCLGGSDDDEARAISLTSDGGYILVGQTSSNDGDVTGNHGRTDIWMVKLNGAGDLLWQKCLGGSNDEGAGGVQQTADGGYIVAGYTESTDGDVTGYLGGLADGWIVKSSAVSQVPGGTGVPADIDADGRHEDVNGNGRADFADVVLYFNQMSWMSANEPFSAFDYNDNGRIDFADVVWVFNRL
jgi:PKD repeat protein